MPSEIAMPMSRRAGELAYATEHFQDLQGAVILPFLTLLLLALYLDPFVSLRAQLLWVATVGLGTGIAAAIWLNRWYKKRFGFIVSGARSRRSAEIQARFSAAAAGLGLISQLLRTLDHNKALFLELLIFTTILLPRCFYSSPAVAALRFRRVLSIGALTVMVSLAGIELALHGHKGFLFYGSLYCFPIILLYDHWLLMRLLGSRPGTEAFDAE